MAIPNSKTELLEAIARHYESLRKAYDAIPPEMTITRNLDGHRKGTKMSLCNLIAYQIGWHETVLQWFEAERAGADIHFPSADFKWNELGQLAEKFYADYAALSYSELLTALDLSQKTITNCVESFSEEALYGKAWYRNYTRGRMIQLNTVSPYKNARARIGRWKKQVGNYGT